jgi:hypothetical protein
MDKEGNISMVRVQEKWGRKNKEKKGEEQDRSQRKGL